MHLADTLSRAYITGSRSKSEEFEQVNAVNFVPMSNGKKEQIRASTLRDEVLQQLKAVILNGWPEEKDANLPAVLTPYYSFRDELTVHDGLVYRGQRLVIPKDLRPMMRKEIHNSHIGVNGCLRRARESMFWPGMNAELKAYISQCETCRLFESKQQKETLRSHAPTDRPWEKIGIDLFFHNGKDYIVIVDYFSNFWEVEVLRETKASTVINKLKNHFARYGIPNSVVSDNGPQFTSESFSKFAHEWDFDHFTSSPGHQQANGKAEAAVKTAKKLIKKAKADGSDPYLAILAHRNTPSELMGNSPAQRMLGRRTRTLLPTTAELLKPQGISSEDIKTRTKLCQAKQAHYYNSHARDLEALEEGDVVRMRPFQLNKKTWEKAQVTKRLDDRSYEVECQGSEYRRNRVDLKKTAEKNDTELSPQITEDSSDPPTEHPRPTSPSEAPSSSSGVLAQQQLTLEQPIETETTKRPQRAIKEPAYLKDYVRYR